MFARRKILPILAPTLISKIFIRELVNDYIDNTATFTTLVKLNSVKCFYSTKVYTDRLGDIFSRESFGFTVHLPRVEGAIFMYA